MAEPSRTSRSRAASAEAGSCDSGVSASEPEELTARDAMAGEIDHLWPEMLPGSKAVLFTIQRASEDDSEVAVLSLATGERRVLISGGTTPRYSRTGHLLYGRAGTLFAVPFDARSLEIRGDAVPVLEGVVSKSNNGAMEVTLGADGALLYLRGDRTDAASRRLLWVDSGGRETATPTPARLYDQVVLAPNERQAAVRLEDDTSVWIADLERGTLQRLADDDTAAETVVLFFSHDGRRIAYSTRRGDGAVAVFWRPVDGSGQPEPLLNPVASMTTVRAAGLSFDGERVFLTAALPPDRFNVGIVDVGEPDSYRALLSAPHDEYGARLAPGGGWISFGSDESGMYESYVQRFPDAGGRRPVTIGGSVAPLWSADGRSLTYLDTPRSLPESMLRLGVSGLDDPNGQLTLSEAETLFPWSYYFQPDPRSQYDMTADGERFLVISSTAGSTEDRLILVQNWRAELERLAPRK